MKYLVYLFSLIIIISSCSKDDDSNPLYINGSFDKITYNEENIVDESVEIILYYTIEEQGYSFYELLYTKLEAQDEKLVENYLIELKLVNDENTEVNVQNSITWNFFPTLEGNYGINYINIAGDTIYKELSVFEITKINEHTMISEDYQVIVDYVINNPNLDTYSTYDDTELYYGANAHYANFDLRVSLRTNSGQSEYEGISEEEASDLIWERLNEGIGVFLKEKYPDANKYEKFIIQFDTYNGFNQKYKAEFVSIEINNEIEFEFQSKELVD